MRKCHHCKPSHTTCCRSIQSSDMRIIELNKLLSPAVVTINSRDKNQLITKEYGIAGSGFLVEYDNKMYVITAAHIVLTSTVDMPVDDKRYSWDEDTTSWIEIV